MQNLKDKYEELRVLRFPSNSEDDELSDIFAELAETDGHVAGLVSSFLEGGTVRKDLVEVDADLNRRLAEFIPTNQEDQSTLESYRLYKRKLDELINMLKNALRDLG